MVSVLTLEMSHINSKTLLAIVGVLAIKHKKCPIRYRKQSQERLRKLYLLYLKLQNHEDVTRRFWVRDIRYISRKSKIFARS